MNIAQDNLIAFFFHDDKDGGIFLYLFYIHQLNEI